jgi:hypothetical protein
MFHLSAEAESAEVGRTRDHAPGGGFLGDGGDPGVLGVDEVVELAQELDGLEVLLAAVLVGEPLAAFFE